MHVLHIIKGLGLAGAENHLITLLSGLRQTGVDARLLLWVSPSQPADDILAAANAHDIPITRWTLPSSFAPLFFIKLVRYLRHERPDIVHTHLVHAETYAIPAARLAGIKTVVNSSHNDDPFRRHWAFRPRNWLLWRLTSHGIAISEHIKQFLIDVESAKPDQVEVIYYGLEPPALVSTAQALHEQLGIPAEARLIGSVCRLVPQKGIRYALDAMAQLRDSFPNLHYVIVGEGQLRGQLEAQAVALGLVDCVHFLGWQTNIQQFVEQFEVFVAPSLWEGFGLVFLEAMAVSKPIVTTQVSSIPEVVKDGLTGHLVPPEDANSLADAISKLLADPQQAEMMGKAGHLRLQTVFNEDRMVAQTMMLYEDLLAK